MSNHFPFLFLKGVVPVTQAHASALKHTYLFYLRNQL